MSGQALGLLAKSIDTDPASAAMAACVPYVEHPPVNQLTVFPKFGLCSLDMGNYACFCSWFSIQRMTVLTI